MTESRPPGPTAFLCSRSPPRRLGLLGSWIEYPTELPETTIGLAPGGVAATVPALSILTTDHLTQVHDRDGSKRGPRTVPEPRIDLGPKLIGTAYRCSIAPVRYERHGLRGVVADRDPAVRIFTAPKARLRRVQRQTQDPLRPQIPSAMYQRTDNKLP